jgi:hypothetical protein
MKTKLLKILTSFPNITFALLLSNLFATDIQIHPNWNMLGVTSDTASSNLVLNAGEVIYTYENETWSKYDTTHTGTIKAGSGFWLYSSDRRILSVAPSNSEKLWSNGWNLVTPIDKTWSIKENFPTVSYAWRWVDGGWKLYDKAMTSGNYGYGTISDVTIGEGIWVKSTHNGFLGSSPIHIIDGEFESVTKASDIAQTQSELITNIKNNFDIVLDKSDTLTPNFVIGIKMTKLSTGNYYYYVVDSSTSKVRVGQYDLSKSFGTSNIVKPIEFINQNSQVKLYFNKIIDYLINKGWFTVDDMNARFIAKENYKMEIYLTNLNTIGGTKTTTFTRFQLSKDPENIQDFPIGSSKIEGILTIK